MAGGIFLIQGNEKLVEMKEQSYDSEDLLQELLAKYPDLLAGDQIDSVKPRRWLLVSREIGVPDKEDGGGRWSLDHLFLDQDATPTLVEVKRSSDTRIRREVVGQMLDYAANAIVYWPVETIIAKFEARCEDENVSAEHILNGFFDDDVDQEQFWQKVKTNLQAGKVRMVFVADEIPSELRRVVEFMNSQMDPAEVLAVEVKQYVGEGLKTLVPKVIGQTEEARRKKSSGIRSVDKSDSEGEYSDDDLKKLLKKYLGGDRITQHRMRRILFPLCLEYEVVTREMIKHELVSKGEADDMGKAGTILTTMSRELRIAERDYLRQVIAYDGNIEEEVKDNYRLRDQKYKPMIQSLLTELDAEPEGTPYTLNHRDN